MNEASGLPARGVGEDEDQKNWVWRAVP